jgi:hypothetical protein
MREGREGCYEYTVLDGACQQVKQINTPHPLWNHLTKLGAVRGVSPGILGSKQRINNMLRLWCLPWVSCSHDVWLCLTKADCV